MIPNERLQELLDDADVVCYRGEDGEDIDFECIAQELLTLRQEKQLLIENSERLAQVVEDTFMWDNEVHNPAWKIHNKLMNDLGVDDGNN